MNEMWDVSGVAHVIQLAVAPVFLLSGIGAMLAVMTNRLSRVIDRARVLESRLHNSSPEMINSLHADLATLSLRAKLVGRAITFCTITALLICTVIAILFPSFRCFNSCCSPFHRLHARLFSGTPLVPS